MTKRIGGLFSLAGLLCCLLMVVGCELDSSGGGSSEVDEAIANARAEASQQSQPSSSGTSGSGSSSSTASAPSSSGSSAGFIWKPISEGDGKLVILLPSSFRGKVSAVEIQKGGSTLERGRFAGDTHNGNRPHYRFSKPGSGYGSGLTVVAFLKNGSKSTWSVPSGGQRVG